MSDPRALHEPGTMDPAEVVCAWESVEELLEAVPEGTAKDVLRMVAAGLGTGEIAERLDLARDEVEVLAARARIRVLTAAAAGGRRAVGTGPAQGSPRS